MSQFSYQALSPEAIAEALSGVPGWAVEGNKLVRTWTFESYPQGPDWAVRVGEFAEALNHHPDILIGYCRVTVSTTTHDAGNQISEMDFELARRLNAVG
ncbi:MAG TPA: 4a-hydroxytetrahydrobiopterin dehydratase [Fimbriimonadaceae bacterium]|nr:4a-hydroxytetrahydrobiopterin dehydratase [Fimbriimonadaceae bacterium]HRE94680.1 4a-hydroxytetrahydrobiopterin dehydratase [Fimbriimonadaceae bacterium]HRI74610.1 4a-hydroxytetrahydrobiopterin dehydratase [Fimbriimonadaceae bacterium]